MRRRASRERPSNGAPARPQPANMYGRQRQPSVSTWQRVQRLSGCANSGLRRKVWRESVCASVTVHDTGMECRRPGDTHWFELVCAKKDDALWPRWVIGSSSSRQIIEQM